MSPWDEIRKLLSKDYPCTPALKSLNGNQLIVRETNQSIRNIPVIETYLSELKDRYEQLQEQYLSLWIVFDSEPLSEDEFEKLLFKILEPFRVGDHYFYQDSRLFIVGMHQNASRPARKFAYNSMVVNLFEQFETLRNYQSLVKTIRDRETAHSGSVNPMTLKHGDGFEEIQFSGKENPDDWKIPK